MAIPLANILEGCCDDSLSAFNIINVDALDTKESTCDKVIELNNTYVLVEEKSLLLGFFNLCCEHKRVTMGSYKREENGEEYINLSKLIELTSSIDIEIKKRLLIENLYQLTSTSEKKVSNTTHILATQFDSSKTAGMKIFYLYCNSGKPVDRIMSNFLSLRRYKSSLFIECKKLKEKLQEESI